LKGVHEGVTVNALDSQNLLGVTFVLLGPDGKYRVPQRGTFFMEPLSPLFRSLSTHEAASCTPISHVRFYAIHSK